MSWQEIEDRIAITDVLHRYARGLDRMDKFLPLSCWHPGGTEGPSLICSGSAEGFLYWLWKGSRTRVMSGPLQRSEPIW